MRKAEWVWSIVDIFQTLYDVDCSPENYVTFNSEKRKNTKHGLKQEKIKVNRNCMSNPSKIKNVFGRLKPGLCLQMILHIHRAVFLSRNYENLLQWSPYTPHPYPQSPPLPNEDWVCIPSLIIHTSVTEYFWAVFLETIYISDLFSKTTQTWHRVSLCEKKFQNHIVQMKNQVCYCKEVTRGWEGV